MIKVTSITISLIMVNLVSSTDVVSAFRNLKLCNLKVQTLNSLKTRV